MPVVDDEARDVVDPLASCHLAPDDAAWFDERGDRQLEDARYFSLGGRKGRALAADADDGVEAEAADMDVDRREGADEPHVCGVEPDLLVRLAKRRLLEGFAGIDHAARQRHLTAMPFERIGSHRQQHARLRLADLGRGWSMGRVREEQACGVAGGSRVEARRPLAARAGGHECLGVRAGQGPLERGCEPSGNDLESGVHPRGCGRKGCDRRQCSAVEGSSRRSAILEKRRATQKSDTVVPNRRWIP